MPKHLGAQPGRGSGGISGCLQPCHKYLGTVSKENEGIGTSPCSSVTLEGPQQSAGFSPAESRPFGSSPGAS